MSKSEKKLVFSSIAFPAMLVLVLIGIHFLFESYGIHQRDFALVPRSFDQLHGIITAHLIHADWSHLGNNCLPLFVLGSGIGYFFRREKWGIYGLSLVITGVWTWAFARPNYHLGASGLVYAWAGFLFVSGVLRKSPSMYALSFLIVFLYGSMIWGIFPIDYKISWESHLLGGMSGLMLGWYYRTTGPQTPKYSWEIEEDIQLNDIEVEYKELTGKVASLTPYTISYTYEKREKNK